MNSLTIYLPQVPLYQLEDLGLDIDDGTLVSVEKLTQDWQEAFCQQINYPLNELPWSQLRLAQFEIEQSTKTVCCCDPVLMQLTHRGAYMAGQHQLQISENDAIRVVAQINERLMGENEQLLIVDKHSWLFTSEKNLSLESLSVRNLIGKDMFNHAYGGEDASFWQQLNNEIQMLIKEMVDYQGLSATSPETMMNVHFYDAISVHNKSELPFVKQEDLTICTDNELIKTFCMNSLISQKSTGNLSEVDGQVIVLAFDSEKDIYHKLIDLLPSLVRQKKFEKITVQCMDAKVNFNLSQSMLGKLFSILKK